jgi:diguanylate cyclase (GGDEF)-like protein
MPVDRYEVLLVDADRNRASTIARLLDHAELENFRTTPVGSFGAAAHRLREESFDLVLLDLALPDAPGLQAVTDLLAAAPDLPIVVLSGLDDERFALEAVLHGAQDYLIESEVDASLLRRSIRHAIERKRLERELCQLAKYDPLTRLPNRTLFRDRLALALRRIARHGHPLATIFIDLDGFKAVNDRHGHLAGDRLLAAVAKRLLRAVRRTDTVARFGGDEFTVLLEELQDRDDAVRIAEKILADLRQPFELEDLFITLGASIGIAVGSDPRQAPDALIRSADEAMYRAKADGGAGYRIYTRAGFRDAPDWQHRLSA